MIKLNTPNKIPIDTIEVKISLPNLLLSSSKIYSATNFTKPEVIPKLARLAIDEKDNMRDQTPSCSTPILANKYLYKKKYNKAVKTTCKTADRALIVSFFEEKFITGVFNQLGSALEIFLPPFFFFRIISVTIFITVPEI